MPTQAEAPDAMQLETVLHQAIPATEAIQLRVAHLSSRRIRLEAPVAQANVNIHGTAFAGSIYSVSAVAAWGLVYQLLEHNEILANLVIAEANIRYQRPTEGVIAAESYLPPQQAGDFMCALERRGKAVLTVETLISDNSPTIKAINKVKLVAVKRKAGVCVPST